jgi:hypothetical protein
VDFDFTDVVFDEATSEELLFLATLAFGAADTAAGRFDDLTIVFVENV